MKQLSEEDKQLLLKDLSARLAYGIMVEIREKENQVGTTVLKYPLKGELLDIGLKNQYLIRPYLRPMSSMTEEEKKEYDDIVKNTIEFYNCPKSEDVCLYIISIDWLNAHHFDYRGLIEKGLALEAPADMYNTK